MAHNHSTPALKNTSPASDAESAARKHVEHALQHYELLAFSSLDILLFINYESGRIIEANTAALTAYGYTREELLQLTIPDLRSTETYWRMRTNMDRANADSTLFESVHRRKDGTTFPVEVSSRGTTIGGMRILVSTIRDITERKQVEAKLTAAQGAIINEKNRLKALFEALPVGVAIVDSRGGILSSNRVFEEIRGSHRALTGHRADYPAFRTWCAHTGEPVHPEEWAPVRAVRSGQPIMDQVLQIERYDGTHAFIMNSGAPIFDADGIVSGCAVALLDISTTIHTEQALRRSELRASLLSESAGLFLTSHRENLIEQMCCKAMQLLDCELFLHFLVDERNGKLRLNACAGVPEGEIPSLQALEFTSSRSDGCTVVDVLRENGRNTAPAPDLNTRQLKSYGLLAYASHPLLAGGKTIGTLAFGTRNRSGFSPEDLAFMQTLAAHVVAFLDRNRLIEELRRSQEELETRVRERTAELERSNAILREQADLLDMAHDAILVRDMDDRIVFWNQGAEHTYGWKQHEAIGKRAHKLLITRSTTSPDNIRKALFDRGVWRGELQETTAAGKTISISSRQALRKDPEGRPVGILVINRDITDGKKAEKEIRSIPARLIAAQEEERKRIGGELHDSIGQILAALKYQIEAMMITMNRVEYPSETLRVLEQMVPTLQFSIAETRNIYMGLKPTILYELGVVAALQWFCRDFSKLYPRHHIELRIETAEEDIPQALKIVIFRITQEALNNVAKHSKAEWVDVVMEKRKDRIDLTICDNGQGFDPPLVMSEPYGRSMGLTGMRERAEIMAGTFRIESCTGQGTKIHASWPAKGQMALPFPPDGMPDS